MKNFIFIVAGLTLVVVIVAATLFYEQPEPVQTPVEEVPVEEPVETPEPTDEEPVFDPEEVTTLKIYFSNSEEDPNTEACGTVYAVERDIEPAVAVAKESLDQLLAGVTAAEKSAGYFTNLNSAARVESIAIEQGIATVVFGPEFQTGLAGSCKVTAVRAQIEETLKQFPTVEEVVIKVEGVPDEEVLQP